MSKEWSEDELREIASQLGKPDGDGGVKVAERMAVSNANMTARAIATLGIGDGELVLEIGPGNASHLKDVIEAALGVKYHGIDISKTMVDEASARNIGFVRSGDAVFSLSDGARIDFEDDFFDKIFTVNTLYFWQNPDRFAREIHRVLKPEGSVVIAIADKRFMQKLPFTQFGFQLYSREEAVQLLTDTGFRIESVLEEIDETTGNMGQPVSREIILIRASRA